MSRACRGGQGKGEQIWGAELQWVGKKIDRKQCFHQWNLGVSCQILSWKAGSAKARLASVQSIFLRDFRGFPLFFATRGHDLSLRLQHHRPSTPHSSLVLPRIFIKKAAVKWGFLKFSGKSWLSCPESSWSSIGNLRGNVLVLAGTAMAADLSCPLDPLPARDPVG